MAKRIVKWSVMVGLVLVVLGFGAFLYLVPPFTLLPPETFVKTQIDLTPATAGIPDPATRLLAERGKYLVLTSDCAGCHTPPGPDNMVPEMYLAGGMRFVTASHGTVVSRNLTPDEETGLGRQSPADIARTLRSGVRPDGRSMSPHAMPWPLSANWTDEERHAVITYLRHIRPVGHAIPDAVPSQRPDNPSVVEAAYGMTDAGVKR